jgi:hypothetical protein
MLAYMLMRDAALLALTAFLLAVSWPFGEIAGIVVSFLEKPFQPVPVLRAAAYFRARLISYHADRQLFIQGGHMVARDMARLYQDEDDL